MVRKGGRRILPRVRSVLVSSVLAVGMFGAPAVRSATVGTVSCGQVITRSTTLTADVGPCRGDGLIIRADGITLDLGGHTVLGARTQTPAGNAAGIRLVAGTGVTVRHGTVTGFDGGVVIDGGSANTLTRLVVRDNVSSANPDLANPPTFTAELGDGIVVIGSGGNHIERNVVRANGIYDNIAVLGAGSDHNTIAGNEVDVASGSRRKRASREPVWASLSTLSSKFPRLIRRRCMATGSWIT